MTTSSDSPSKPSSGSGTGGNFANNPERARDAGRKGGEHSHDGQHQDSSSGSHSGKSGNFADDEQKASEAGRKGGQHSHGGSSR